MPDDVANTTTATAQTDNGGNTPAGVQNTVKDPIPYDRFKEINDKAKAYEAKIKEYETAAAEAARKQAEAETERMKQQGEFKTLAETWQQKATELEPYKVLAEEANATLKTLLDAEMANPAMPASTKELLADMSPTKALAHITKHKGEWAKPGIPNLNGAGGGKVTEKTDAEKAELAALYGLDPRFID